MGVAIRGDKRRSRAFTSTDVTQIQQQQLKRVAVALINSSEKIIVHFTKTDQELSTLKKVNAP